MTLATFPLLLVLAGLALYIVLAGADFGAAIWQVSAPKTEDRRRLRAFAHNVMAPVWEANHVWLIFVLTVTWTAYPAASGSIASTLAVGLSLAMTGIVVRGAAYAVSAGTRTLREEHGIDRLSVIASITAPFALGACLGGIASGRVPYGNANGDLVTSWLNPTSVVVGALSVCISAYLAAVYLCDDARRRGEADLIEPLRRRALGTGTVAGVLAAVGLLVLRADARPLLDGLLDDGLPALLASFAAGLLTLVLVARRKYAAARWAAVLAVAAVVAGWALAQHPQLLPGLTVQQAAAPRDTLIAILVAAAGGAVVLAPSLLLLLRLALVGRLGYDGLTTESAAVAPRPWRHGALAGRIAVACGVAGVGLLTVAEARPAHALGVVALLAVIPATVVAAFPQAHEPHMGGST